MPTERAWRLLRPCCFALALLAVAGHFSFGATPAAVGLLAPPLDKAAHMLYFGALAALLSAGWRGTRPLAAFLVACCVGAADEVFQMFLPGRHPDGADLAAGMAGALVGAFAVRQLFAGKP
ncbi:MAG: hypothetical protein EFKGCFLK_02771 [Rhodocyclaceae bacterium]|nr:MAG: VanZ family protein [Rhodocyclaceae bacterium]MBE7421057.1 VanZ family protein [Zoogloeaceae bacterium]MBV6409142.1 hypothetical protein [Rhodocyclaceae bacterium]MCK6384192.1 VanZ family protein [Rhodocyclaceae bacterium]CAG0930857.1 hypothetical protein RHDC3_01658 [Rhodocyclaceae bacterium]